MVLARHIEKALRLFRNKPFDSDPPTDPAALGTWGEAIACRYLEANAFRVLYRNYRAKKGGEVDIVARDKPAGVLCFIEVKTRSSDLYGRPADAVDEKKRRLIIRGALSWLRLLQDPDIPFRFDIVEVHASHPARCNLIRDAFHLPGNYFP